MVRVAINGFGRIGRMVFRAGLGHPYIEFVALNDLTHPKVLAYFLKHDSVYRELSKSVSWTDNSLIVGNTEIPVFAERDPEKLPWKALNVDVVVESTGFFTYREGALKHLKAGAGKVLITAPAKNPDVTIVKGVNEHLYNPQKHFIISNASCTTNAVAPVLKVLNDNFRVKRAFFITNHAYTSTQALVDRANPKLTRGRAAAINIIPTTTGASRAVEKVIPELKSRIKAMAYRIPVPTGSVVDITAEVEKPTTVEQLNWLFSQVSRYHLRGVLEFTTDELVSSDVISNPHSAIYEANHTQVLDGTLVKVVAWYDNEWGYSNRVVDLITML